MFYLLVLATLLWEKVSRPRLFSAEDVASRAEDGAQSAGKPIAWLVVALVALHAAHVGLVAWSAYAESHQGLPFPILNDRDGSVFTTRRMVESLGVLLIVCLESTLLYFIWRRLPRPATRATRTPIVLGTAAIIGLSLLAPALSSADPYLYVGYSLLGSSAYSPAATPFTGEFFAINKWWGTPLLPAPYGPLFIVYVHALVSAIPSLVLKIEALRLANGCWFLLALWFLRRCGTSSSALPLIGLNPAIAYLFIANGHNDIIGITLILGALTVVRRYPLASVSMIVAAGLIKAPFAIVGLPILSMLPARRRPLYAAATLLAAGAASYIAGGTPYVRALRIDVAAHIVTSPELHAFLLTVAGCAILMGLLRKQWALSAAFAMPAFAARMFSWYAVWGLPYAAAAGRIAGFAILLPIVAYLMESCFDTRIAKLGIAMTLLALALAALARRRREASVASLRLSDQPQRRRAELRGSGATLQS